MKRIFSSVFLIFVYPTKFLKKIKINNFLGGLILGAIVTLIVNIATVQIQEGIKKQRILEAVENEILSNLLLASGTIKLNDEWVADKNNTNYLHYQKRYSSDLWEQSTEPLEYVSQLPRRLQNAINSYYTLTIPTSNELINKIDDFTRDKMGNCVLKIDLNLISSSERNECRNIYEFILIYDKTPAKWISNASFDLLKIFHPTQDRLNNFFLRLIMGNEAIRPLADK